jgi:hypothetical protein
MAWYTRNSGKEWTAAELKQLRALAKGDTPTPVIGFKLGRTPAAIYSRASEEGISLMPPNPHHKKKKYANRMHARITSAL